MRLMRCMVEGGHDRSLSARHIGQNLDGHRGTMEVGLEVRRDLVTVSGEVLEDGLSLRGVGVGGDHEVESGVLGLNDITEVRC